MLNVCWDRFGCCSVSFLFNESYSVFVDRVTERHSQNTNSTATLTIAKVSAQDFQTEFKCIVVGFYTTNSITLRLKRRGQSKLNRLLCICSVINKAIATHEMSFNLNKSLFYVFLWNEQKNITYTSFEMTFVFQSPLFHWLLGCCVCSSSVRLLLCWSSTSLST